VFCAVGVGVVSLLAVERDGAEVGCDVNRGTRDEVMVVVAECKNTVGGTRTVRQRQRVTVSV
jgi:hypothetical protein